MEFSRNGRPTPAVFPQDGWIELQQNLSIRLDNRWWEEEVGARTLNPAMNGAAKQKMGRNGKDELRASLISLAKFCPVDECNPEDCPLFQVRKMKLAERLKWFDGLAQDDLTFIAVYHHICMSVKLKVE